MTGLRKNNPRYGERMAPNEETLAARKEKRRLYMCEYRARKRAERLAPRSDNEVKIVAVDLLAMLEDMLKARAGPA